MPIRLITVRNLHICVVFPDHISADGCIFQWCSEDKLRCKAVNAQGIKKLKGGKQERLSVFDRGGGETVKKVAADRMDESLLIKIRNYDLFASEAMYHR